MNETLIFLGERETWQAARLLLDDVQALWGGRQIVVNGDGTAVITIILQGGDQQTRQISLSQTAIERLFQLCVDMDFVTIQCKARLGLPDEAQSVLTLVNGNGRQHSITKWANDKNERFDALYAALLRLEQRG